MLEKLNPHPSSQVLSREERRVFDELLKRETGDFRFSDLRTKLQSAMEKGLGIFRDEKAMTEACRAITEIRRQLDRAVLDDRERLYNTELTSALELGFMLDVAEAVAWSGLLRNESRGSHFRADFTKRDDSRFLAHTLATKASEKPAISYAPVTITRWQPAERKY
jgi:succinate dehydrogenase/fumarate reductase flavoprotein subunit